MVLHNDLSLSPPASRRPATSPSPPSGGKGLPVFSKWVDSMPKAKPIGNRESYQDAITQRFHFQKLCNWMENHPEDILLTVGDLEAKRYAAPAQQVNTIGIAAGAEQLFAEPDGEDAPVAKGAGKGKGRNVQPT